MSYIYVYKVLLRSSGGPNPWCWEKRWFIADNKKDADEQASERHNVVGDSKKPIFVKSKRFVAKKCGEGLPNHWVNAPCGYFAQRSCSECGNFWPVGGCRNKFGDNTGNDKFCHFKKSKFWYK